jgi:hypothetical protein
MFNGGESYRFFFGSISAGSGQKYFSPGMEVGSVFG